MNKSIKIFLASSSELKEDREKFEIAINRKNKILNKQGLFLDLVIWEDFLDVVSLTRLQDEYNEAIKECDIFVLLFFTKVGMFSEEEFGVALDSFKAKGKPFLITYFKNASINTGDISDEMMSLLEFKKRLSKMGHFYSSYKNTEGLLHHFNQQYEKLYDKYLKEDTSPIITEEVIPKEEPTPPAPKRKTGNFPTKKSYFTERTEELKEFQDAYTNNNFLSISGTGGIGKTQFTARCIEACKIPEEKIVWFECEPSTTLDAVINYAGFPEILKGESKRDKEKVLAFIDKINEHGLVLFLEDYHYVRKQSLLVDLLKICDTKLKSGKIIVISRDNMVSISFEPKQIYIKGFESNEVLLEYLANLKDFFKIRNKYTNEELLKLSRELEGHPLAIFLACILISKAVSIEEIIEEIIALDSEENVSERLLNAIFDREDATEDEKEFIKNFSAFRGKVSIEDVENIFSKKEIKTAWKLQDKNLLVIEDEQLSLHPLVREFCYKKLDSKIDIHKQISTNYIAHRQELLEVELEDRIFYHLIRGKEHEKISETIVSHGRQFIQQGFTDVLENMISTLESNFAELPDVSNIFYGDILERKGEWDYALTFYEKSSQSTIGKVRIEGHIKIGEIYFRKNEAIKANLYFIEALDEIKINNQNCLKEKARALNNLGLVEDFLGNKGRILDLYNQSLEIREEINDQEGIAVSFNNIAHYHHNWGNNQDALLYNKKSLNIRIKIGDKVGIAGSFNNLGQTYYKLGNKKEGLEFSEKSLKLYEEIGNKQGIANCYLNIGPSFKNEKDSLEYYEKSLKLFEEIGSKTGIANCYLNMGISFDNLKKIREAKNYYEKSLKILEEIGEKKATATCLFYFGLLCERLKKVDKACFYLLKSYSLNKQMKLLIKNEVKNSLINLRKKNKTIFKEAAQKAYDSLSEDLQEEIDMNDILGLPIKAKKQQGRNELCKCGSGRKYKNCHGIN